MYGRTSLDRFKKAQSLEPFSVTLNAAPTTSSHPAPKAAPSPPVSQFQSKTYSKQTQHQQQNGVSQKPAAPDGAPSGEPTQPVTQERGGQSSWQPPDWAIEPRPGVYYLEVLKDAKVLEQINLDKRRHVFGRQFLTCDFVLDHQSVSRQHAAVVPHRDGSIYVIDLGAAHGTFVANERLTKDCPVELEVGQSLRFAASTRTYVLRKNKEALFPPPQPAEINLPPPPDPSDEEAVVEYNTVLNRYCLWKVDMLPKPNEVSDFSGGRDDENKLERSAKRKRKMRVTFRDQVGGELVEVVGISDGADVETEPGPVGVKEGSLVGKYESLVQSTVIPKGHEDFSAREDNVSQKGVTDRLQVLSNPRAALRSGMHENYGQSLSGQMGIAWEHHPSPSCNGNRISSTNDMELYPPSASSEKLGNNLVHAYDDDDDDDDLF